MMLAGREPTDSGHRQASLCGFLRGVQQRRGHADGTHPEGDGAIDQVPHIGSGGFGREQGVVHDAGELFAAGLCGSVQIHKAQE